VHAANGQQGQSVHVVQQLAAGATWALEGRRGTARVVDDKGSRNCVHSKLIQAAAAHNQLTEPLAETVIAATHNGRKHQGHMPLRENPATKCTSSHAGSAAYHSLAKPSTCVQACQPAAIC
jgi:hypothetical protein